MVTLANKFGLPEYLETLGYEVHQVVEPGGKVSVRYSGGTESDIQAAIDAYDPLIPAQTDAIKRVKSAADETRRRYANPEKDGIYLIKAQQAKDYLAAVAASGGTELTDTSGYEFVVSEQHASNLPSVSDAANFILGMRDRWLVVMLAIEDTARPAITEISALTSGEWRRAATVADSAIAKLGAI